MPVAFNREEYNPTSENPFLATRTYPLSTFSIDVDAASYSNIRRYIMDSQMPPWSISRPYFASDDSGIGEIEVVIG